MSKIDVPSPPQELLDFFEGDCKSKYVHFDFRVSYIMYYIDILWGKINPTGNVLNMGISGRKTPGNLSNIVQNDNVKSIIHVELRKQKRIRVSDKETVIWKTDFFNYVNGLRKKSFNGVVFWHGPEHLEKKRGLEAIANCIRVAKDWTIISCPWDRLEGWKAGDKLSEKKRKLLGHKSVWTEVDFLNLGLKTLTIGERNIYPSFMLGWIIK